MGASKVLGILSLCLGWLIPILGLILGIIGMSIKKAKGEEEISYNLNLIGIIASIGFWILWAILWFA